MRASWEDAGVDHGTYQHDSVCRRARQVAVLCEGLKKGLMQRGIPSDKLTVVSNGVNVDHMTRVDSESEFKQRWNLDGKKIVGFIGSFYRYEGLELLVEAMGLLCSKRDDVVLLLVGTGEMEAVLNAQIANSNLGDLVIMPGKVPHDRIPEIYSLIDILVYPRYSMRLTELVTPLKPLEAMCMEKALVASDVGGHRELIQDGFSGVLFPAGDAVALANTLHRLLDDHVLRRRLGGQAAEWVRRERSWEKTTSVYLDIYSRVL